MRSDKKKVKHFAFILYIDIDRYKLLYHVQITKKELTMFVFWEKIEIVISSCKSEQF